MDIDEQQYWNSAIEAWDMAEGFEQRVVLFCAVVQKSPGPSKRAREFVEWALLSMSDNEKRSISLVLGITMNGTNLM